MFHQSLYSDDGMMGKVLIAIIVVVVLYFLYKTFSGESVIANPYAGTFDGFYPFTILQGAVKVPAVNY